MPGWLQTLTGICALLGIGGVGASPFFIKAQIRKFKTDGNVSEATAAETIQKSATALLQPAIERAVQLDMDLKTSQARVFQLTLDVASANAEVAQLRNQVDKMSKDYSAVVEELEDLKRRYGGTVSG
jgi:chromosome segregation ATPase